MNAELKLILDVGCGLTQCKHEMNFISIYRKLMQNASSMISTILKY